MIGSRRMRQPLYRASKHSHARVNANGYDDRKCASACISITLAHTWSALPQTDDTVTPVVQPILDHVSDAVNPQNLAAMDVIWHPWM